MQRRSRAGPRPGHFSFSFAMAADDLTGVRMSMMRPERSHEAVGSRASGCAKEQQGSPLDGCFHWPRFRSPDVANRRRRVDHVLLVELGIDAHQLGYNLLWRYASYHNRFLGKNVDTRAVAAISRQYMFGPLLYLVAFGLAWFNTPASLVLNFMLALFFALPGRALRQLSSSNASTDLSQD